jgi:transcription antitermination factor NusG
MIPDGRWFAVHVRPRYEFFVSSLLTKKGYQTYAPGYAGTSRPPAVAKRTPRPLLPGYIFCRFDSDLKAPVVTTPGVLRIVGTGNTPVAVNSVELERVVRMEKEGKGVCPHAFLSAGQWVRIEEGPLEGVEGIFIEVGARNCLVVSINLLQRSVCVHLDRCRISVVTNATQVARSRVI